MLGGGLREGSPCRNSSCYDAVGGNVSEACCNAVQGYCRSSTGVGDRGCSGPGAGWVGVCLGNYSFYSMGGNGSSMCDDTVCLGPQNACLGSTVCLGALQAVKSQFEAGMCVGRVQQCVSANVPLSEPGRSLYLNMSSCHFGCELNASGVCTFGGGVQAGSPCLNPNCFDSLVHLKCFLDVRSNLFWNIF